MEYLPGGTLKQIREAGIQVISVSTFTGSPEIMGGRVKTLHPKVHAGILYRRDNPKDEEQLADLDSKPIDLVVVNLYPFKQTVARKGATENRRTIADSGRSKEFRGGDRGH